MVTKASSRRGRDREGTERRLLEATGLLLAREGFRGLGVNRVAKMAGVDKVLVYRYFGGLEGLLEAYARSSTFWPSTQEVLGATQRRTDLATVAESMLSGLARGLRRRPVTQEVLSWELVESNPLAERTAEVRERVGLELMANFPPRTAPGVDIPAVAAILSAGLTYLVLRSRTAPAWLGVSLQDEDGWRRLEKAAATVVRALFAPRASHKKSGRRP